MHPLLRDFRAKTQQVAPFNEKVAVVITTFVGSMWCAYLFGALAFLGLPAALKPGGLGPFQWFAQTFLQLVLLSVIIVGQNVQAKSSDERAKRTFEAVQQVLKILSDQGGSVPSTHLEANMSVTDPREENSRTYSTDAIRLAQAKEYLNRIHRVAAILAEQPAEHFSESDRTLIMELEGLAVDALHGLQAP